MVEKKRMIVDTDCGVDDAQALMIALGNLSSLDILGITCVSGNVHLDRVLQNVTRVQHMMSTKIPVYKGAAFPLTGPSGVNASFWHGKDGLGDSGFEDFPEEVIYSNNSPTGSANGSYSSFAANNASLNIVRLAKDHPGEISIVALGPLTNIALAILLEPQLPSLVKELWWMGGSRTGLGNVTKTAEFNAFGDPEALSLCLNSFKCVHCVDWQATLDHGLSFSWFEGLFNQSTNPSFDSNTNAQFMEKISRKLINQSKISPYFKYGYMIPDPLCMIAYIFSRSREEHVDAYVEIELSGKHTRGMMIVDDAALPIGSALTDEQKVANVRFYTVISMDVVKKAFYDLCF